jgi:hypothetical protein
MSGRTFLMELKEAGLANVKAVPRTSHVWIGINKLRGILPRFSFRVPERERGLEALCAYQTVRETSTGIARDEPCHDASSHACDALRVLAEAEAAHMLSSAGRCRNMGNGDLGPQECRAAAEHNSSASFYTTGGFSLCLGGTELE